MPDIYRPLVKVGSCITLTEMSIKLGGTKDMLRKHEIKGAKGFPKTVARFGNAHLYVEAELDAFYKSMLWRQGDRSYAELTGDIEGEQHAQAG